MRVLFVLLWVLVPIVAVAYHLGPGQEQKTLDDVAVHLAAIQRHAQAEEWQEVVARCDLALAKLPKERVADARRIVLERAKARMLVEQLPEAHTELTVLVDDLRADPSADPQLLAEAQGALANAQYYVTWLMRLEGRPREDWEPQIEASRQTWRMLAEQSQQAGNEPLARRHREDLEAAVRLARLELSDLQGLALPCQCQGCKSGQCKKPGNKPGKRPGEEKKDARGASAGPPPDGRGS